MCVPHQEQNDATGQMQMDIKLVEQSGIILSTDACFRILLEIEHVLLMVVGNIFLVELSTECVLTAFFPSLGKTVFCYEFLLKYYT